MKKTFIFSCIAIIIDYVSKILVTKYLVINDSLSIINKFLYFTYVRNTGAAFSMFSNYTYILAFISIVVIAWFLYYISKKSKMELLEEVGYGLLIGGAVGNLIDRIVYGYVVDFVDVKIFGYDFPIFNLADTFIVIGFGLLVILETKKDLLVKKSKK